MKKRAGLKSRSEVTDKIETNQKDMEEKEEKLDITASDVETVRETVEQLDFSGTEEGADELENSMEETESVTTDVFNEEDEKLETTQEENQEFEDELGDNKGSAEGDLGKVVDASAKTETTETVNAYLKVKETVIKDIDFLIDQIDRGSDAREKSETIQQEHRARVNSGKGRI